METRNYGSSGPRVAVLHGGPGAPGYMAPVARRLGKSFRVIEPMQRRCGEQPLTVARHIADLEEMLHKPDGEPTAIVGHSWGAMLALAFAAAYPRLVASMVLIGSGTFDLAARQRLNVTRDRRIDNEMRDRMRRLTEEIGDPDLRMKELGNLMLLVDSHDLVQTDLECGRCDARGFRETWDDMLGLQKKGVYPAALSTIKAPVVMLHGAVDPHPGKMIFASLKPHLPQLEYREWDKCGHYPWLERAVRQEFLEVLEKWLARASA